MMTETTVTVTTTEGAPGHNATSQPTVKSDPGQGQNSLAWIRLNFLYFRTIPGILKLLQVVSYHPSRPQENRTSVGFECLAAVTMKFSVVWDVTPCCVVDSCQRFGGIYAPIFCLKMQVKASLLPRRWRL
jgi:hypothetical protein